ncbi:MAG: hypothetical protein CMJ87_09930 [Planctomycetes bacterium]|nr:hypothetical protein [Planctomycetota bacterium]
MALRSTTTKGSMGPLRRLGLVSQVIGTVLLGMIVVFLLNWLSGRPGLRLRLDLSADGSNTLDRATSDLLADLTETVTVDVFYRGEAPPLQAVAGEAMERVFRLLILAADEADGRLIVQHHDPADSTALQQRLTELKLTGFENCLVLSRGAGAERRVVLSLRGDLAEFDPGRPQAGAGFSPAAMIAYHGEEALVSGLMRVTQGSSVPIAFSAGHGERDIFGLDEPTDLGRLHTELVGDGFAVEKWRFEEDGPPRDELALLAVIAPQQPFSAPEAAALVKYVERGGRLLIAPRLDFDRGPGSVPDLVGNWGLAIDDELILRPWINAQGQMEDGRPECAQLGVRADGMSAGHPLTDALRRSERRVVMTFAHPLRSTPAQNRARALLVSGPYSWLDDGSSGTYDFIWQEANEVMGSRDLLLALELAAVPGALGASAIGDETRAGRVLLCSTPEAFANTWLEVNRDFCLGAFNWLTERETRIHLAPRTSVERRLAMGEGQDLKRLKRTVAWLLPGLCLITAILVGWRRRS